MGAGNFGDLFLKNIQLVAMPIDNVNEVLDKNEKIEIFGKTELTSEEEYNWAKKNFEFLIEDEIKPFIDKVNDKLNLSLLSIVDGYYDGIQIELTINAYKNESNWTPIDERIHLMEYTQEEFDNEIKKELETIKDFISNAKNNGLDCVNNYSAWLKPSVYDTKSEIFIKTLEEDLKNLSNSLYDYITDYEGYENHSELILKEIFYQNTNESRGQGR